MSKVQTAWHLSYVFESYIHDGLLIRWKILPSPTSANYSKICFQREYVALFSKQSILFYLKSIDYMAISMMIWWNYICMLHFGSCWVLALDDGNENKEINEYDSLFLLLLYCESGMPVSRFIYITYLAQTSIYLFIARLDNAYYRYFSFACFFLCLNAFYKVGTDTRYKHVGQYLIWFVTYWKSSPISCSRLSSQNLRIWRCVGSESFEIVDVSWTISHFEDCQEKRRNEYLTRHKLSLDTLLKTP